MMNPSFTREEKLFVLAEIIKASRIDVDSLVHFIKYHNIEPDWMSMQIPLGRNMNQCMQFAEHISIVTPSLKRRPSGDDFEHPAKRLAFSDLPQHTRPTSSPGILQPTPPPSAPIAASHTGPVNGLIDSLPQSLPPVLAKKRGRPSRADKAKRDLRPLLPQHLAPRPSPGATLPQILSPTAPRPILPAISSPHDIRRGPRSWSPPIMYRVSPGREDKSPDKGKEHYVDAEVARPRLCLDGTFHPVDRTSPPVSSENPSAASMAHKTTIPAAASPSPSKDIASTYDVSAMAKRSLSAVSAIGREVTLTNPA